MALLQGLSPARGQGLAMSLYLFLNWNSAAIVTDAIGNNHDTPYQSTPAHPNPNRMP